MDIITTRKRIGKLFCGVRPDKFRETAAGKGLFGFPDFCRTFEKIVDKTILHCYTIQAALNGQKYARQVRRLRERARKGARELCSRIKESEVQ